MVMGAVDWGTFPEWLAAIGTVGALIAAVVAIRSEFESRERERSRLRVEQASLVSAGIDWSKSEGPIVRVTNASRAPIYNVTAMVGAPAGHEDWTNELMWNQVAGDTTERAPTGSSPSGAVVLYEVTFKDSAGCGWRRGQEGELFEIEPPGYLGCS